MQNQHLCKICILLITVNVTSADEKRMFLKTDDCSACSIEGPLRAYCEQFGKPQCFNSRSIINLNCACTTNSPNFHNDSIDALNKSGARFYTLPISWQSIIPNGRTNYADKLVVKYYNAVIDNILKNGVVPLAMIDFPPFLQGKNKESIDFIGDYARFLFGTFGSRIKYWLAIEEHCSKEKVSSNMENSKKSSKWKINRTLTSSRACHIFDKEFRDAQKGQFCLACKWNPETITADVLMSPVRLMKVMEKFLIDWPKWRTLFDMFRHDDDDFIDTSPFFQDYLNATLEANSECSSFQHYFGLELHNPCDLRIKSHSALVLTPFSNENVYIYERNLDLLTLKPNIVNVSIGIRGM